ncbi:MAG: hypothetical protein IT430_13800 [Phycisphaerales bacterium]|nr:hypothetical protein [Phycisphaerales bacterium]
MSEVRFDKIARYLDRTKLVRHESGCKLTMPMYHGAVEVFTCDGTNHDRSFTCIDYRTRGAVYTTTLPRFYHERWVRRLARCFVRQIEADFP